MPPSEGNWEPRGGPFSGPSVPLPCAHPSGLRSATRHSRPPCLVWQLEPLPKPGLVVGKFLASAPLEVNERNLWNDIRSKTWSSGRREATSSLSVQARSTSELLFPYKQKIWFIIHISPVQPWLKQTTLMKCWFHASEHHSKSENI